MLDGVLEGVWFARVYERVYERVCEVVHMHFLHTLSLTRIPSNQTRLFVGKITWTDFDADGHTLSVDEIDK